jgi:hypothetical protein
VGLFGRRAGGRHALGAAVTSIPSGPVPVAVAPSAVSPPVAVVPSDPVPEPAPGTRGPLLIDEITALLASGEAWAGPEVETSWSPVALSVAPPPVVRSELGGDAHDAARAVTARSGRQPVLAPEPGGRTARPMRESALTDLLPAQPHGPRVQLGFRDGTTTALDPASSQSLALEELAQSLRRLG